MSLFSRRRPAVLQWPLGHAPLGLRPPARKLWPGPAWGAGLLTPRGLRLARAGYVAAFAAGWLFFALAPVALVGPDVAHLRIPGMLAGVGLAGAATAAFARALRCPWRDSLLLGLLAIAVFPMPLLLLARRYRQLRRASFAPLN